MVEPKSNILFFCEKHAPPIDKRARWLQATFFVGKFVKKSFPAINPLGNDTQEHMWVKIKGVGEDGLLIGELNNDPLFYTGLKNGDTVKVAIEEIEMWQTPKRKEVQMTNKEKFPKGQVVLAKSVGWPGIVVQAPLGKNGKRIELLEVFGAAHEMGSAWCEEYEPCSLDAFYAAKNRDWPKEKIHFKGKLIGKPESDYGFGKTTDWR